MSQRLQIENGIKNIRMMHKYTHVQSVYGCTHAHNTKTIHSRTVFVYMDISQKIIHMHIDTLQASTHTHTPIPAAASVSAVS